MSDRFSPLSLLFLAPLFSFFVSLCVVRLAIAYAQRRRMFDQPGQRRSHTIPTPRGGGIGLVIASLVTLPLCIGSLQQRWPAWVLAALVLALLFVAAIGWWDDHRPLPALPRFAVQVISVSLFSIAILANGQSWLWLPLLILAGSWSINLHNFMDGIDGLLAQQGIFVSLGLAAIGWMSGQLALAGAAGCVAAACLGFWCFNRAPARIFMGDVGSGSVGLLLFMLSAMLWVRDHALLWPALLLSSSFAVDASLTLVSRILNGRRWYTPHREHLYQWVARKSGKHIEATRYFLFWNLLVAVPFTVLSFSYPGMAWSICIAVYMAAAAAWLALKRRAVRRDTYKVRHVST